MFIIKNNILSTINKPLIMLKVYVMTFCETQKFIRQMSFLKKQTYC